MLRVWGVSPNVVLYKDAAQVSQETGSFTFEHTAALDHLFICEDYNVELLKCDTPEILLTQYLVREYNPLVNKL